VGVEMVYHVAGVTKAKTKAEYYSGNTGVTTNMLGATMKANGAIRRFVHVSSQAAVGPSEPGKPADETTPYHPLTNYAVSKMQAEQECHRVMGKLPVTIVRPPAVYGPRDTGILKYFETASMGLQPLIGFDEKYLSLIHVDDLAEGIILAGEHPAAVGQTYFITSEMYYTWRQIGEVMAGVLEKNTFRLNVPHWCVYSVAAVAELMSVFSKSAAVLNIEKARDIVQRAWICDGAKSRKDLGFDEKIPLEAGFRSTWEWYKKQGWLKG
jgi:nucleoside-diphosphate-sugar epimerase